MEKILTVSVAAYNVSETIKDTLQSLVTDEETMQKIEVIVVDDGSSDNTFDLAKEFEEKYSDSFRIINKENGGYGSTINTSVKVAKGKYFKQLDGGDKYITENLRDFVEYLDSNDADIIVCPHVKEYVKDSMSETVDDYKQYNSDGVLKISDVKFDNRLWMHGIAFKTGVWNELGRDIPEHCFYTDMEYVLYPFVKAETIAFFDKPVYRYYLQCEGQSVSTEGIKKHYKDSVRMMWDLCDLYDDLLKNNPDESKRSLFELSVNHAISFVYTSYLKLDKNNTKEIEEIDHDLKEKYFDIYKGSEKVKRLTMMRKTGFKLKSLYKKMIISFLIVGILSLSFSGYVRAEGEDVLTEEVIVSETAEIEAETDEPEDIKEEVLTEDPETVISEDVIAEQESSNEPQTDEQIDEINNQISKDSIEQIDEQTTEEPAEQPDEQTTEEPAEQPDEQTTEQTENQLSTEPAEQTENQISIASSAQINEQSFIFAQSDTEDAVDAYIDKEVTGEQTPVYNAGSMSGDRLSGMNRVIYDRAKLLMGQVAEGQECIAQVRISYADLGISTKHYTASELGVSRIVASTDGGIQIDYNAVYALFDKTGVSKFDSEAVSNALENDCTFEGYWVNSISFSGFSYSLWQSSSGEYKLSVEGSEFVLNFEPTQAYKGQGSNYVDINKTKAVKNAISNINSILNEGKSCGDYSKIVLYKNKICSMTDFDANSSDSSLISVFDGDSNTRTSQQGYCRAYAYLCEKSVFVESSIKCYMVMGYRNRDRHFWNILHWGDGINYFIDPGETDRMGSDVMFLARPVSGSVSEGYTFNCNGTSYTYYYDEYTVNTFTKDELTLYNSVSPALKDFTVSFPASVNVGVSTQFILVRDGGSDKCKFRLDYANKDGKSILGSSYNPQYVDNHAFNITFPSEGTYEVKFSVKDFDGSNTEKSKTLTIVVDNGFSNEDGLVKHSNGIWYYVKKGVLQSDYTGLVKHTDGNYYYVQKGIIIWGVNGLTNINGTWYYLKNSTLEKNYTGLVNYSGNWYYVQKGELKWGVRTLVQYNGTWYYVNNSTVDWKYTGICSYNGTDYYVQKGAIKWGVDGLTNVGGTWYYLKNSAVRKDYTSLVNFNGSWYYVQKGELKWGVRTLVQYNGTWYYVNNSTVDWKFTGIFSYNGTDYYIQNGSIKWGVDGLTNINGTWYYLKNSALRKNYTGLVQNTANKNWYYVQKGVLKWGVNAVVEYNGTWYYVNNSTLDWNYTGLAQNPANKNWYYVQKGVLKWGVKTLVQYNGTWYYVNNSTLDWKYTGLCSYNGTDYYIQRGVLEWGVNGKVNIGGKSYTLKNSQVVK